MKSAWILVAALGAVSVTSFSVVLVMLWRQRRHLSDDDMHALLQSACTQQEADVEPELALEAVMSVAAQIPEFAAAWDYAVCRASDELSATIAGRQMAGIMSGDLDWHATVPVPGGMPPEVGHAAFDCAVRAEVTRRITLMTGPGAFG